MVTETDRNKARSAVVSAYHALDCVTIPFSFPHAFADAAVDAVSTDAEPVAWQFVYLDGTTSLSIYDKEEAEDYERRSPSIARIRPLYAEPVKTAPSVAEGSIGYTEAIGEAAQAYFKSFEHVSIQTPGTFRFEELWNTMQRAALSAQVQDVAKFEYRLKTPEGLEYARLDAGSDEEAHQINLKNFAGRLVVEKRIVPEWETVERLPASPASKHGDAE